MSVALSSEPSDQALRARILAGILFAAARFMPVPLLDDLVRRQVARWMVKGAAPDLSAAALRPLSDAEPGCLPGCLGRLAMLPIQLLLFPFRKVLAILRGARWVSRDLAEMVLLGRVIDHARSTGLLSEGPQLEARARELRTAFDVAFHATDAQLLSTLLGAAVGPLRGLVSAAMRTLRRLRRARAEEPRPEGADAAVLDASVGRIEAALRSPPMRAFLADFDARFLENLRVLELRRA